MCDPVGLKRALSPQVPIGLVYTCTLDFQRPNVCALGFQEPRVCALGFWRPRICALVHSQVALHRRVKPGVCALGVIA